MGTQALNNYRINILCFVLFFAMAATSCTAPEAKTSTTDINTADLQQPDRQTSPSLHRRVSVDPSNEENSQELDRKPQGKKIGSDEFYFIVDNDSDAVFEVSASKLELPSTLESVAPNAHAIQISGGSAHASIYLENTTSPEDLALVRYDPNFDRWFALETAIEGSNLTANLSAPTTVDVWTKDQWFNYAKSYQAPSLLAVDRASCLEKEDQKVSTSGNLSAGLDYCVINNDTASALNGHSTSIMIWSTATPAAIKATGFTPRAQSGALSPFEKQLKAALIEAEPDVLWVSPGQELILDMAEDTTTAMFQVDQSKTALLASLSMLIGANAQSDMSKTWLECLLSGSNGNDPARAVLACTNYVTTNLDDPSSDAFANSAEQIGEMLINVFPKPALDSHRVHSVDVASHSDGVESAVATAARTGRFDSSCRSQTTREYLYTVGHVNYWANTRSGPGEIYSVITRLDKGSPIYLTETTPVKESNSYWYWYEFRYEPDGSCGWIREDLVQYSACEQAVTKLIGDLSAGRYDRSNPIMQEMSSHSNGTFTVGNSFTCELSAGSFDDLFEDSSPETEFFVFVSSGNWIMILGLNQNFLPVALGHIGGGQ